MADSVENVSINSPQNEDSVEDNEVFSSRSEEYDPEEIHIESGMTQYDEQSGTSDQIVDDFSTVRSNTENSMNVVIDDEAIEGEDNADAENGSLASSKQVEETVVFEQVEDPFDKATQYLCKRHIFELFQVSG